MCLYDYVLASYIFVYFVLSSLTGSTLSGTTPKKKISPQKEQKQRKKCRRQENLQLLLMGPRHRKPFISIKQAIPNIVKTNISLQIATFFPRKRNLSSYKFPPNQHLPSVLRRKPRRSTKVLQDSFIFLNFHFVK